MVRVVRVVRPPPPPVSNRTTTAPWTRAHALNSLCLAGSARSSSGGRRSSTRATSDSRTKDRSFASSPHSNASSSHSNARSGSTTTTPKGASFGERDETFRPPSSTSRPPSSPNRRASPSTPPSFPRSPRAPNASLALAAALRVLRRVFDASSAANAAASSASESRGGDGVAGRAPRTVPRRVAKGASKSLEGDGREGTRDARRVTLVSETEKRLAAFAAAGIRVIRPSRPESFSSPPARRRPPRRSRRLRRSRLRRSRLRRSRLRVYVRTRLSLRLGLRPCRPSSRLGVAERDVRARGLLSATENAADGSVELGDALGIGRGRVDGVNVGERAFLSFPPERRCRLGITRVTHHVGVSGSVRRLFDPRRDDPRRGYPAIGRIGRAADGVNVGERAFLSLPSVARTKTGPFAVCSIPSRGQRRNPSRGQRRNPSRGQRRNPSRGGQIRRPRRDGDRNRKDASPRRWERRAPGRNRRRRRERRATWRNRRRRRRLRLRSVDGGLRFTSQPTPSLLHQDMRQRYHDHREVRVGPDAPSRGDDASVSVRGAEQPLERRLHQTPRGAVDGPDTLGKGSRWCRRRKRRIGTRVRRGEDAPERLDALATQLDVAPADERLDEVERADIDGGGVDGLREEERGGIGGQRSRRARRGRRLAGRGGEWARLTSVATKGRGGAPSWTRRRRNTPRGGNQ